jgi:hypothetical protein
MAFILVLALHKSQAYSRDTCQIVVPQTQSKRPPSKAAMHGLHDVWQNLGMFFSSFQADHGFSSVSSRNVSVSASAKWRWRSRWPG